MPRSPRERMVFSAVQLIRARGVSGTGMRDVVTHADAPRGSLTHYFPGGKEQLVDEAITAAGDFAAQRVRRYADALEEPTPGALFAAMAGQWRDEFSATGYAHGCPLVAAAADVAATSESLRQSVATAFARWQRPLAVELERMGVAPARAGSLAVLMISALEGAIVLSRTGQDLGPLDTVVAELRPLLDAAVDRRRRRPARD